MIYKNCTPHTINLNDGRAFEPSGSVARVGQLYYPTDNPDLYKVGYDGINGLPDPEAGVLLIVSAMVRDAAKHRTDLVSPATGHKDCVKNEKGHILSVPFFIQ